MSNTIRSTVQRVLDEGDTFVPEEYEVVVDAVVEALEERESDMIDFAAARFLDDGGSEVILDALIEAGYHDEPEPESAFPIEHADSYVPQDEQIAQLRTAVEALAATVQRLVRVAQDNGLRV